MIQYIRGVKIKKILSIFVSFILVLNIVSCKKIESVKDNKIEKYNEEFNDFLDEEFKDSMEADYLNNHYSLYDSSYMGIIKPEPLLDPNDFSIDSYADSKEDGIESLNTLKSFDLDSLSEEQIYTYKVYEYYLENYINLNDLLLFDNVFDSSNGIQENLLTIFIEFEFRNPEEFEDYLKLLSDVSSYVEAAIDLTKYQASYGFYMSDSAVDETVNGIDSFTSKVEDNELIILFNNSCDNFDGLSKEQKQEYKERNKDIIINSVIPAYINLKEELINLKGSRRAKGGISSYDGGKEYYQALLNNKTGSNKTSKELFNMCQDYLDSILLEYVTIYQKNPDAFDNFEDEPKQIRNFDTSDILEFIKENMIYEYPLGPDVNYTISYLDETVANDSILAYYLNPPIDNISNNIIKVNPNTGNHKMTLYTTIAHEGFPGHLYQVTYYLNTNPHPLRRNISNIGYTEGWAMYTELNAIDYLDITYEQKIEEKLNIKFNYVLLAALDIMVNGLGYNLSQTSKWLDYYINPDYIEELYQDAIDNPGTFLPYGIGLMYYENLRDSAKKQLKDKFDPISFHEVILKNGDKPLYLLEEDVNKYISLNK
ncbi:MAG: DUF885 domain-containing protein [Erysipelotrichaceae bacterium]|nr:DUF885 domain-containing protein [Erysipelotrichaceae bacterium]